MASCWVCQREMSSPKTGSCCAKRRSDLMVMIIDAVTASSKETRDQAS